MYRPSPAPPRRLARQNWRKIRGTSSGGTPSPSSRTDRYRRPAMAGCMRAGPPGRLGPAEGVHRLYHDSHGTSTVPDRVLDQVAEDLVDLVRVQPGLRQLRRGLDAEPVGRVTGGHPAGDDLLHPLRDVDQLAVHLDPARPRSGTRPAAR